MGRRVAVLLALTACGGAAAFERGAKLEAAGNWSGAYLAYQEAAAKHPDDTTSEAAQALERARDVLVAQDIAAGKEALAQGNYEGAVDAVERVLDLDPDRPEAFQLRIATESKMSAAYLKLWTAGEVEEAYAFAVRMRKVYPKANVLGGAFEQLHATVVSTAEQQLQKGQHAEALATIRTIVRHEPDRQDLVAPVEQKINAAWADALGREAKRQEAARKLGAAAALYARAYEVGNRAADVERAHAIAADLAPTGRLRVKLEVTGPQARVASMRSLLGSALAVVPDVSVVQTGTSDSVARVVLTPSTCTETEAVAQEVAATGAEVVETDNPEWDAKNAELAQARAEQAAADADAENAARAVEAAENALRSVEEQIDAAERETEEAEDLRSEATTQLEGARSRAALLEEQLASQRSEQAGAAALAETQRQIGEVEVRVAAYADQVRTHAAAREALTAELQELAKKRHAAEEALARIEAGEEVVASERDAAREKSDVVSSALAETATQVADESGAYLRYDVHTFTRACTAPATVSLKPAWRSFDPAVTTQKVASVGEPRTLSPRNETTDRSHQGYPDVGVTDDPKAFPVTDLELVAQGDTATASELATWLTSATDTFFRDRVATLTGPTAGDPKTVTTAIVGLYVGAPSRVDPAASAAFEAHVHELYGLDALELLRAPPAVAPAPAPPPAVAPAPPPAVAPAPAEPAPE